MTSYRKEIDEIDQQLVELLVKRMKVSENIGRYKEENNLPVFDAQREREKLNTLAALAGEGYENVTDTIYPLIFDVSRSLQFRILKGTSPIYEKITKAIETTDKQLPSHPMVACQGVEGAYSQLACQRIFPGANILYFNSFDAVFSAVEQGLCKFGILPIENSSAGSVNRVYDLMSKHDFYIFRSCRVKVDHCLLANKGVRIEDIREIYSHEQAISQCSEFLKTFKNVKIVPCENTAMAAKFVQESGRRDVAALSSLRCAELYGLECISESVQNNAGNFTRFICITKELNILPGADRSSLMLVLPNRRGALYRILSRFNALNINLLKLESRPLPNSDFEFMFYFDIETSIYSDEFLHVFDDIESAVAKMKYLGSYTELV
ncbi:MAG: chorismate mutase [Oscillospiraceae bacterium]|nr:chorismate mutase [Oscillospiraceae bacterium]